MAAAALGNTISDVLGIGSAVYVERFVEVIGVRPPDLTPVQLEMKSARRASNFVSLNLDSLNSHLFPELLISLFSFIYQQGRVMGITVGCILGMIPLLFFKDKDEAKTKKDEISNSENNSDSKKQEKQENTK
jgi:hypothetical protein